MNPSRNIVLFLGIALVGIIVFLFFPKKGKVYFLAALNSVFYMLCDVRMMPLLIAGVVLSWLFAAQIEKKKSKKLLWLSIILLLLPLVFFKYYSFLFEGIGKIFGSLSPVLTIGGKNLLLPVGISYYVFKTVSYTVDVYRGKYEAEKNFFRYYAYVTYFAEILCGPISRYDSFGSNIDSGVPKSRPLFTNGFYLIIKGLFMKIVIADCLSVYTGNVFSAPDAANGITLWMAAFLYAIEIYCDFGGYSYIANGISVLLGMNNCINFNRPYFSQSIREFWNRWHISLSQWLRDYIYIPLGGNRCGKLRRGINVMAVFFVSGVWHGSGLTFILWGFYHGIFNLLSPKKHYEGVKKAFLTVGTFLVTVFGWILFASDSLKNAFLFYSGMVTKVRLSVTDLQDAVLPFTGDSSAPAFFLVVMAFILILFLREWYEEKKGIDANREPSVLYQIFLLTGILLFGNFGVSSFLYANF